MCGSSNKPALNWSLFCEEITCFLVVPKLTYEVVDLWPTPLDIFLSVSGLREILRLFRAIIITRKPDQRLCVASVFVCAIEYSTPAGTSRSCRNIDRSFEIYFMHLCWFTSPVLKRILNYTERINPNILESKFSGYEDGILEDWLELLQWNGHFGHHWNVAHERLANKLAHSQRKWCRTVKYFKFLFLN
jgi:hypothetical protein